MTRILDSEPFSLQEEQAELRAKAKDFLGAADDANRTEEDRLSTPLPGETLAVFYARSSRFKIKAFLYLFLTITVFKRITGLRRRMRRATTEGSCSGRMGSP